MDLVALHETAAAMTAADWNRLWLRAAGGERVEIALPAFPPEETQRITNNISGVETMRAAGEFYRVADEEITRLRQSRGLADLKLLDFGAGWGRITRLLLRSIPPQNLYGTDVDERLVETGQKLLPGVSFAHLASGGPLPYADAQFDVVVANSVFSHLSLDYHLFYIKEIARVMRPGGLLLATTLSPRHLQRSLGDEKTRAWLAGIFGDLDSAEEKFSKGMLIHGNTNRWPGYGMTYIPDGWTAAHWAPHFEVTGTRQDYRPQDVNIAIRKPS